MVPHSIRGIRNVWSLIRASPAAYRFYLLSQNSIQAAVLANDLPPQVLSTAVACAQAQDVATGNPLDIFQITLKTSLHSNADLNERVLARLVKTSFSILHLQSVVDRCIQDFVDFCALVCTELNGLKNNDGTSRTELHRLRRGFYRFELLCRLLSNYRYPDDVAPGRNLRRF